MLPLQFIHLFAFYSMIFLLLHFGLFNFKAISQGASNYWLTEVWWVLVAFQNTISFFKARKYSHELHAWKMRWTKPATIERLYFVEPMSGSSRLALCPWSELQRWVVAVYPWKLLLNFGTLDASKDIIRIPSK